MIRIGTVYPYRYVHTRESELTLESGIIESCLNRLCRVQCVSYSELHGARRADSCWNKDEIFCDDQPLLSRDQSQHVETSAPTRD